MLEDLGYKEVEPDAGEWLHFENAHYKIVVSENGLVCFSDNGTATVSEILALAQMIKNGDFW